LLDYATSDLGEPVELLLQQPESDWWRLATFQGVRVFSKPQTTENYNPHGTYSFQGFGTTLYGMRDFRNDGSYVTTKWFILAGIPIIPLESMRVHKGVYHDTSSWPLFGSKQGYQILEITRPNWKQVLSVYAFFSLFAAWLVLTLKWQYEHKVDSWIWVLSAAIPVSIPFIMRWIAKRNARR
jgi:hypothetical protein